MESWSFFTVKKHWVKPNPPDFNDWLKEKSKARGLTKNTAIKKANKTNNQNWWYQQPSNQIKCCIDGISCEQATKEFSKTALERFVKIYPQLHSRQGQLPAVEVPCNLGKDSHAASQDRGWSKARFLLFE